MRLGNTLLGAVLILGAACGGDKDPAAPTPTFSVTPNPAQITVRVDSLSSVALGATIRSSSGQAVTGEVNFVSEDPTVARVNFNPGTGEYRVIGVQAGTTRIRAVYGAGSPPAFINVTVTPRPVVQVDLTPPTASVLTGSTVKLTATLLAGPGDTVKALRRGSTTLFQRTATFSVAAADANIATVNSTGTVTGVRPGTARVIATYKNTTKAATFTNADTATVADTSIVTVTQSPVTSITVLPTSASITRGGSVTLRATCRAANGSTPTCGTLVWTSSNPAVATVATTDNTTAIVTGVAVGDVTITVTDGTNTQTVPIAVR